MSITVVFGRNGSGKTRWVEQMRRTMATDKLRYIAFRDTYGPNVDHAYYLQQRWNQHDIDAETPTAGEALRRALPPSVPESTLQRLISLFSLGSVMDKYIITLSSGELRKFQLVKTLLHQPQTLILDNPFIGLDAETRQQLRDLLLLMAREQHMELYLVVAKAADIPDYADRVINMQEHVNTPTSPLPHSAVRQSILDLPYKKDDYESDEVIRMHNVSIRYGERTILKELNWCVRRGERWALSGPNGSGKSTLLSLVCADNPQSYACDIALFGYQRGESGESIWDIKRHIGYVSPELARSYHRDLPALRIVASGLKDTVGLYVRATADEQEQCRWWMRIFGIAHLADRSFLQLSSGEQRLVLLARAFVKDPELLILDEPLHGLDDDNCQLVKEVIEAFCQRRGKTLIMVSHYAEELPACITHSLTLNKIA